MKIENLTPEQEAKFPEYVKRWTEIGLCTEPADRPRAEAAIAEMYRCGGLEPPKKIVWCGSPLSLCLTHAISKELPKEIDAASVRNSVRASVRNSVWASVWNSVRDSVEASVRNSVEASVRNSVWASVGASVRASVRNSVRASVWDSVCDSVAASVWDSVCDSVEASVRNSVEASVRNSVWASVWDPVYGSHDAPWLAFYEFFRDECGLTDETQKLAGLWELANSAGWCAPMRELCLVSERHTALKRDGDGRLHCENGPAVAYPDGWEIYAWRGTVIPAEWIREKAALSPETALTWKNVEQRRAAAEIIGWDNILAALSPTIIDEDQNPEIGTLLRCDLPGWRRVED